MRVSLPEKPNTATAQTTTPTISSRASNVCTLIMALAVYGTAKLTPSNWSGTLAGRVLDLGVPTAAGVIVYFIAAFLFRLEELRAVTDKLLRRK